MSNDGKSEYANVENLSSMVEMRLQESIRMNQFIKQLAQRYAFYAFVVRFALIVFGAIIATRVVADQVAKDMQMDKWFSVFITIAYTFIGICVSILAGLEASFQYSKKVGLLTGLLSVVSDLGRNYMSRINCYNYPPSASAQEKFYKKLLEELNDDLESIHSQLASHGFIYIPQVDYSRMPDRD